MSKKISDLLPNILSSIQKRVGSGREELFIAWHELLGPSMSPMTKPVSFLEGVLTVEVKSAALYSCLCQYERPRLLKSLQEKYPGIGLRTLRFLRR
jgi:predicted nucleic acid-binding Zn ribbon protein